MDSDRIGSIVNDIIWKFVFDKVAFQMTLLISEINTTSAALAIVYRFRKSNQQINQFFSNFSFRCFWFWQILRWNFHQQKHRKMTCRRQFTAKLWTESENEKNRSTWKVCCRMIFVWWVLAITLEKRSMCKNVQNEKKKKKQKKKNNWKILSISSSNYLLFIWHLLWTVLSF